MVQELRRWVIDVKSTVTETADEVADRIRAVLEYVPAERLGVAPTAGLINLPRMIAAAKLRALQTARPSCVASLAHCPQLTGGQESRCSGSAAIGDYHSPSRRGEGVRDFTPTASGIRPTVYEDDRRRGSGHPCRGMRR